VTTPEDLQQLIAKRFSSKRLSNLLSNCDDGICGSCGDVCPVRARNWRQAHARQLRALFADPALTVYEFHFSCSPWHKKRGQLSEVNPQTIFKATRRALDSLRDPTVIAVGLADAAWSGWNWKFGITILLLTSRDDLALCRAFDRTEKVVRPFEVEMADRPYNRLKQLLRDAQQAKIWQANRILLKPAACREYYRWLAGLRSMSRLFRYGVDRHFNKLEKEERLVKGKARRRHPNPSWLEPYQYGSHRDSCDCGICRAQKNR
jgi:hypothetical protein